MEISARFEKNDQAVVCVLADVAFSRLPKDESFLKLSDFYGLDVEVLRTEKNIHVNYRIEEEDNDGNINASSLAKNLCFDVLLDLLQVSLLINKQTRGKKKRKMEGKKEGQRDLWTTCSGNETCGVHKSCSLSPFPTLFSFFFPPVCILIKSETWSKSNGLHVVLPELCRAVSILATIPETSCSAERSFSGQHRMKKYLRSTMGQERLNTVLMNIERKYCNEMLKCDVEKIIDAFGKRIIVPRIFFYVDFN